MNKLSAQLLLVSMILLHTIQDQIEAVYEVMNKKETLDKPF